MAATMFVGVPDATAQGNQVTETIIGRDSGRAWKSLRNGVEQGTAWRQPGFDDSGWADESMLYYLGREPGNHDFGTYFREEFEIDDVFQISQLELDIYYDDAVVLYLNGEEIYRTIRGNIADRPINAVFPVDTVPQFGGLEDIYIQVPAASNPCSPGCANGTATSPVDVSLLEEGTNVFAAITWTTPNSDIGFDLAIDVVRDLDAPLPNLVLLNEVVAANDTLEDEDGDTSDWFELHNPGADPVPLNGWTVSDNAGSWTFPNVTIAAGDYLTVFASDKDRAPTNGDPLHTSFKLSKEGDLLKLTNPDSIVTDEFGTMPRQIDDVAWGRVLDGDTVTYLASTTPGASNSGASTTLTPILRPFSNRLYNVGDPVELQIDAFDPDGDPLTYAFPNTIGLVVDASTGVITGTANSVGEFTANVVVSDGFNNSFQPVTFTIVEAPTSTTPFVLNEYNAVAADRELDAGSDPAFPLDIGNGGDWYEFVVTHDLLDLRGWTLQFWDRDRADEILDRAALLTFGTDPLLSAIPAGTIITISEDRPDDLSFDVANGDWTLNFQSNSTTPGAMFSVQENFNSTRDDQHVEIRDASGVLRSPIVGETEPWDAAGGGVSGGEVMNLCIDPVATSGINPVTDYADNGVASTYGAPNKCTLIDPNDPAGLATITFDQDLTALRATAREQGDVNCDGVTNVLDAVAVSEYVVTLRGAVNLCTDPRPNNEIRLAGTDVTRDGVINVLDAVAISQCVVGLPNQLCD